MRYVDPPLQPVPIDGDAGADIIDLTWFQFSGRGWWDKRLDLTGVVNSRSRVFVSISEIGVFDGQWKPFIGLATCQVHNIAPHDDGIVIVRGHIAWERDINVRLSVFVA